MASGHHVLRKKIVAAYAAGQQFMMSVASATALEHHVLKPTIALVVLLTVLGNVTAPAHLTSVASVLETAAHAVTPIALESVVAQQQKTLVMCVVASDRPALAASVPMEQWTVPVSVMATWRLIHVTSVEAAAHRVRMASVGLEQLIALGPAMARSYSTNVECVEALVRRAPTTTAAMGKLTVSGLAMRELSPTSAVCVTETGPHAAKN